MYRYFMTATMTVFALGLASPLRGETPDQRADHHLRTYLGVMVDRVASGSADEEGVMVERVTPNSPAARAGLRAGDVITRVGRRVVEDFGDLANAITRHQPGERVNLHVMRNGQERNFTITLGARASRRMPPADEERGGFGRQEDEEQYGRAESGRAALFGVRTQTWRQEETGRRGVRVTEVEDDSAADRAGLRSGDVIVAVEGRDIASPQQLRQEIQNAGAGREVALEVRRGGRLQQLHVRLQRNEADREDQDRYGRARDNAEENRDVQQLRRQVRQLEDRIRELERNQR